MIDKLLAGLLALTWLLASCGRPAASPTPTGKATATPVSTVTAASTPTDEPTSVEVPPLKPYTNAAWGIRAVAPAGWDEIRPGLLARGDPDADPALIQLTIASASPDELLEDLTDSYGLAQRPGRSGQRQVHDLIWSLYSFEIQGIIRDLALAERDGVTYLVMLRSAADERDALYEGIFVPVVEALVPVEVVSPASLRAALNPCRRTAPR